MIANQMINQQQGEILSFTLSTAKLIFEKQKRKKYKKSYVQVFDRMTKPVLQISRNHIL